VGSAFAAGKNGNNGTYGEKTAEGEVAAGRADRRESGLTRILRVVELIVIYLALEWVSAIQEYRGIPVTAWNPGLGVIFASLVSGRKTAALALFFGALLADALVGTGIGEPSQAVVVAGIVALGYFGVAQLARTLDLDARLDTLRDVALLLSAALFGAFVVGLALTLYLATAAGSAGVEQIAQESVPLLVGDLIGIAVVAPLVLRMQRASARGRVVDLSFVAGVVAAALVAALAIIFVLREGDQRAYHAFYFLFIPVVFMSLRNGLDGACVILAVTQVALLFGLSAFGYGADAFISFQTLMAVLTATGLLVGAVSSERDAASRAARRARERMKDMESEAARADRFHLVTGLASSLSHEINQPMTAARAYARTAQKLAEAPDADIARVRDYVDRCVQQIDQAGEILRSTREFLRRGEPGRAPADPARILMDSITLMRPKAVQKRVRILADAAPEGLSCFCDRVQIQQVLMNLIDNSIAALADDGRADGAVIASVRPVEGGLVEFSVRDNGPGVDPEFAARVFEAMATTKENGLGLGLAISAGIVEAHGGRIWLASAAPGATEFRFVIPASPDSPQGKDIGSS
jgi:two-component system sensor kinase FixL